mmetsp:Transcript_980/g.2634  ORF Transcript_980/g.2634 Transcript_980/m.2634 type:complete len:490 (+) Transcript_980:227-1696(+)
MNMHLCCRRTRRSRRTAADSCRSNSARCWRSGRCNQRHPPRARPPPRRRPARLGLRGRRRALAPRSGGAPQRPARRRRRAGSPGPCRWCWPPPRRPQAAPCRACLSATLPPRAPPPRAPARPSGSARGPSWSPPPRPPRSLHCLPQGGSSWLPGRPPLARWSSNRRTWSEAQQPWWTGLATSLTPSGAEASSTQHSLVQCTKSCPATGLQHWRRPSARAAAQIEQRLRQAPLAMTAWKRRTARSRRNNCCAPGSPDCTGSRAPGRTRHSRTARSCPCPRTRRHLAPCPLGRRPPPRTGSTRRSSARTTWIGLPTAPSSRTCQGWCSSRGLRLQALAPPARPPPPRLRAPPAPLAGHPRRPREPALGQLPLRQGRARAPARRDPSPSRRRGPASASARPRRPGRAQRQPAPPAAGGAATGNAGRARSPRTWPPRRAGPTPWHKTPSGAGCTRCPSPSHASRSAPRPGRRGRRTRRCGAAAGSRRPCPGRT